MNSKTVVTTPRNKEHWLELRTKVITSTEVAALFGQGLFTTEFELFHNKKNGEIVEIDQTERMRWGNRLQDAIAKGIAEDEGWHIEAMPEFISAPVMGLGASFDYRILAGEKPSPDDSILEIKTADFLQFRDKWITHDDGTIEPPIQYLLQVQTQLLMSGLKMGYIGTLVSGNEKKLISVPADHKVQMAIVIKAQDFWKRVADNNPPPINWERDADLVISLNQKADGEEIKATAEINDLVETYREASEKIKEQELIKKEAKAKILMASGAASKVIADKFTITLSETKPCEVPAYTRAGYRNFRVNHKKEK